MFVIFIESFNIFVASVKRKKRGHHIEVFLLFHILVIVKGKILVESDKITDTFLSFRDLYFIP